MTAINVTSVNVLDNPSDVTNPLQFEIQYDCLYDLADGESIIIV
jgi:histone chaperone ASF1